MEFTPHRVEWSDAKIARFWDFFSAAKNVGYFAEQVGDEVISIASAHVPVSGNVLDYGCGRGALIGKLLRKGLPSVNGCDFSPAAVDSVNQQYGGMKGFGGCTLIRELPVALPDGRFDCVFFLEAIEHLTEVHLGPTLREIWRLLTPGGHIILTTPHDEDLAESEVICPDCGAIFHRVQHLRSFTKDSLRGLLDGYGFAQVHSQATYLTGYRTEFQITLASFARKLFGRPNLPMSNLTFIGKKR